VAGVAIGGRCPWDVRKKTGAENARRESNVVGGINRIKNKVKRAETLVGGSIVRPTKLGGGSRNPPPQKQEVKE